MINMNTVKLQIIAESQSDAGPVYRAGPIMDLAV